MEPLSAGTIYAVLAAGLGGTAAKWIDSRYRAKAKREDVGSELRDDLWEQVKACDERLRKEQEQCELWRQRYYDQKEAYVDQRVLLKRYIAQFGDLESSDIKRPPR